MTHPPGPPNPPMIPGHMGTPSRARLDALAATLSIFEWLDANGIDSPELARVKAAFMFEHGVDAQRWLEQADPPPSWAQMAALLAEVERLREEKLRLGGALQGALAARAGWRDDAKELLAELTSLPASGRDHATEREQPS